VATCLAGILGQEGKRVLLIDADLRAGSAASLLGVNPNSAGLCELVRSGGSVEQYVMNCPDLNLSFLAAGAPTDRPADLLSSRELEHHLQQAESLFDWIIIDSPSVLALSDASVVAPLCDSTLFVIHADKTSRTLAKNAIERLGKGRECGLVLNKVRNIKSIHYYHSCQREAASLTS